jgi:hypothetical protein
MRIRTTILAATIAVLPVLAFAQALPTAPAVPSATSTPTAVPPREHHDRGARHHHRAEMHAKYQQLNAGDKAKFDELKGQIKSLRQQQMQILGMSKS